MRLIFVNRFFHPDHSATSQMLSDLAFGLTQHGYDVNVITSRLRYDDAGAQLAATETVGGVRVVRVWTSRHGRGSVILRAVDYLTFYLSAAWTLLKTARRGDVLIAMTDPPAVSVVAALVAKVRGARLINWLQDIFPEVAEALTPGRAAAKTLFLPLRIFRNASLRHAERNVAIGALMAERLQNIGVDRERIAVIPNWSDVEAIHPIAQSQNALRADWNLANKFVVGYSGNLGRAHDIETLLSAIAISERLPARTRAIHWVFIGGGAGYERLKREAELGEFKNVSFYPYQPRGALAESLSAADVHIVSLKPELEGLIVPSKFYGIAAAGRPTIFIGCSRGEVARDIVRHDCGATVAIGDALALVETINAMAQDPARCVGMGERARAMCEEKFSRTSAIAMWSRLLLSVAEAPANNTNRTSHFVKPPIAKRQEP
ncbi:glycosyltransferase family 4 protein [Hyphomicrobium sp. MC1]|uniref:glycosyltransferase family 4 protein n=1 Tax=Hyphomicrobium sp. (strain MC1) TaxID=717785 RepID=UPI000213DB23|nr:glycosyltransferase family 4 protein [Hyphomicrobium sp. MC1]CCB66347.1 Glycosyl transferase group 1 [Hyphomicrobium sp. MC1]